MLPSVIDMLQLKQTVWSNVGNSFFLLQAIMYEGQDKNPEMCRVLLTHEVMCR